MKSKIHVLIFSAGEINSVELHNALSHNVNIELFGASSIDRHGGYIFKDYRSNLPMITDNDFIEEFNRLLDEWDIDLVFPNHDTIALFLSEHKDLIHAKVAVSPYKTALVCRDKKKIYDLFADCDFCPHIYNSISEYPVFIKPREGQGAQGALLIKSKTEIPNNFNQEEYVISEYLSGTELSVDCLTDSKGILCACFPRERNRILAGICTAGKAVNISDEILEIAETINNRLEFKGLWFFQVKQDSNGRYKLLEFATRCASTMCLTRARGVNLPLLSVYIHMGYDIKVFDNQIPVVMDRVMITRYKIDFDYDEVYIDYDDTIIEKDKVCLSVMRFLYQCLNKKKRIVLLTKHEAYNNDSLDDSFKKHCIPSDIFERIVILNREEEKYNCILSKNSIFIDNAYSEREKVHNYVGIPVFDVEGIEVLLDWRE